MNETLNPIAGGLSLIVLTLIGILLIMWILFPFLMLRALTRIQREILNMRVDNETQAELSEKQRPTCH